nr:AIPR family protein [uncultured Pseudomonas sp.]
MELLEFLRETQLEVKRQVSDGTPFEEVVFSEIVMQHMSENGMTNEPAACHYNQKVGSSTLKLSGYALSEEADQLDLFVTLYSGANSLGTVPDAEIKNAAEQCLQFLTLCAAGNIGNVLDSSSDIYSLASSVHGIYDDLEQIRIFVLTDKVAKTREFKQRIISGKSVRLEVMDIERLYRHWSEGKPRDEIIVDFLKVSGSPLPCVMVPGDSDDYAYALTAIPGEALRFIYEKFGARLLEANVRSFLSAKGKGVNAGIQNTLKNMPANFMAYNNGIVLVADEIGAVSSPEAGVGIAFLKGMQIVNGGQTTASLYFAKKKNPELDLSKVRVPAKIIIMNVDDPAKEEALISDISRFANSQNAVRQSDLSANKPFHVDVERLSLTVYCPDGTGRWFYERAAGSYNTLLAREGTTQAKLKLLKEAIPASRKISKTDLAKYINAWAGKPDLVSLGAQKNFERLMAEMADLSSLEDGATPSQLSVSEYKNMICKAIIFKKTQSLIRPLFPAFQANIAAYTVSVLASQVGGVLDFERIWSKQAISSELCEQIKTLAQEVFEVLQRTSDGKMISEWSKKAECRIALLEHKYTAPSKHIPEIKSKRLS